MKKIILVLVLIFAFISQMTVVFPSGTNYCHNESCGIYFWGAHEHDGIWHLALINTALRNIPAVFPTFAGHLLQGYNSLLDWGILSIHYLTSIPVLFLYFKVIPVIWFISMIYIWTRFAKIYSTKNWYIPSLLFFVFFGNSFSYVFRLWHESIIWGASGLLSMQSPQMLTNIQYALTLPLIGWLLIIFRKDNRNYKSLMMLSLINFVLMGLKFYGGVVAIGMTTVYASMVLFDKNIKHGLLSLLLPLMSFGLATFMFYNPSSLSSTDPILKFDFLSTVHPILEEQGLFYLPSVANLRNNLYAAGVDIRLVLIELFTLGVFVFFNWGSRIIGIFSFKINQFNLIVSAGIIFSILMNILFIQRGEWWNTVQFLYYATFLSNIYAADTLSKLIDTKKLISIAIAIIIVLITIPNAIDSYRVFSSFPPHSYVSNEELSILTKLKEMPNGVVLALPINPSFRSSDDIPSHIFSMYDTAYVSAFTGKQTYINDLVQLRLMGINYKERLEKIYKGDCSVLNQVKYFYVAGDQAQISKWQLCPGYLIQRVEKNDISSIYSVISDAPNQ